MNKQSGVYRQTLSVAFVLTAGTLWGVIGIFVRGLSDIGLTSIQIVAVRVVVTAVILAAAIGIFAPKPIRSKLLRVRLRHIWCFVGTGLISIVVFSYCYFTTIEKTSLSAAAVLLYTSPVFVMLMAAVLFGEKITPRKVIACLTAFAGCALVTGFIGGGEKIPPDAVVTGLISALGYALYSIFGGFALRYGYSPVTITAYTFFFACAGVLPICNLPDLCAKLFSGTPPQIASHVGLGIALGVVTALLPYIFYTLGLSGIESGRASVIASVEPVVATITGVIAFHESIGVSGITGIVLVLAAVALMNTGGAVNKAKEA